MNNYKIIKYCSHLLLAIVATFFTININAQTCDFTINNTGAVGGDTEYFLELDAAGNIAASTLGPGPISFNGAAVGTTITVLHLVYDSANPPTNVPPTIGDDPNNIVGCTNDFLNAVIFLECLCTDDEISATYTPGGGDILVYFLIDPATGTILDSNASGNFGSDEVVGDYLIQALAYDSANPPTVIPAVGDNISDFSADGCYNPDFLSAACCAQKIACALELVASDPCSCNNDQTANGAGDGTFSETIILQGGADLSICLGSNSTGILNEALPLMFTETPMGAMSEYTVSFDHTDAVGYSADFVDCNTGDPIMVMLEDGSMVSNLSNVCYYPVIDFSLATEQCTQAGISVLDATLINDNPGGLGSFNGSFTYTGPGVSGSVFNPSGIATTPITITATYTPANAVGSNVDADDTVCTTSIDVEINVKQCGDAGSFPSN